MTTSRLSEFATVVAQRLKAEEPLGSSEDDLLWELATASAADISTLTATFFDNYPPLPIPIMVVAWRLLGLQSGGNVEQLQTCINGIAMHCDPIRTVEATAFLEELLEQALSSKIPS